MIIKRKCYRYKNGKRECYIDDSVEYHSFQEIKEVCYKDFEKHTMLPDVTVYKFIITDTDEEINISCQWLNDGDDDYYTAMEIGVW